MRVTAQAKELTRAEILRKARKLFNSKGFHEASTRDVARAAGIATGTLFNYFPTKEALAMDMIATDADLAEQEFQRNAHDFSTLDEALFAHVATALKHLEPHRRYLGEVIETAWSPFARGSSSDAADRARRAHLETVAALLGAGGYLTPDDTASLPLHLYWSLYLGVLAYWSSDESVHQQATLALLDRSMKLFVASLNSADLHEPERKRS